MDKDAREAANAVTKAINASNKEYKHFLKLDDEKRERVLAAAYDEFLEKGYGEASTNIITRNADISKGLLFHYFGSKEGLYKFLMKESIRRVAGTALTDLPAERGDVLTMIKSIIHLKIKVCLQYPKETNFLIAAWKANLPENLLRERENMFGISDSYLDVVIGLLEDSLLRDSVEKNVAAEIIAWVCEKYTAKALSGETLDTTEASWNRAAEDLDKYMDALRYGLYK